MPTSRSIRALCALAMLAGPATAQSRPNFAGVWTLDADKTVTLGGGRGDATGRATGGGGGGGGGSGLGPAADQVTIVQDSTVLRVEERRGTATATLVYDLKGKKTKNVMPVGRGGAGEATYQTKWDKAKLVTKIERSVSVRGGTMSMEYREVREITPDGTMVVEVTLAGRPGGRKVFYTRAN